jgi:hypothetical protein
MAKGIVPRRALADDHIAQHLLGLAQGLRLLPISFLPILLTDA